MSTSEIFLRIVVVIVAAMALRTVRAEKGDFWLDLNLGSHHSEQRYLWQGEVRKYHQTNLGLGATYELARWCEAKAGWFDNSYHKTSVYGVVNVRWPVLEGAKWSLAPGLAGGLITGYKNTPEKTGDVAPWGMITLSLQLASRWRVNLGYLPSRLVAANSVDVAMLQVSFKL